MGDEGGRGLNEFRVPAGWGPVPTASGGLTFDLPMTDKGTEANDLQHVTVSACVYKIGRAHV